MTTKPEANPWIETNEFGDARAIRFPDLKRSPLGLFIIHRLSNNRDVKGLVTSKGHTTGTGKTMEAIKLSRTCFRWAKDLFGRSGDWSAERYGFRDVYEYIDQYQQAQAGDVLITDELQTMIDKRRSMSHKNVRFSHAWQELRYKNVVTWGTAPGLHNLDKRITENTDIWVNIVSPGRANVYFLTMNDFTEKLIFKRFAQRIGGRKYKLSLLTLPLDENDSDYQYLHSLKTENDVLESVENYDESDLKQAKSDAYNEIIKNILQYKQDNPDKMVSDMKQTEIAREILDGERSQQHISKLKQEILE